jgi:hypothetical protein
VLATSQEWPSGQYTQEFISEAPGKWKEGANRTVQGRCYENRSHNPTISESIQVNNHPQTHHLLAICRTVTIHKEIFRVSNVMEVFTQPGGPNGNTLLFQGLPRKLNYGMSRSVGKGFKCNGNMTTNTQLLYSRAVKVNDKAILAKVGGNKTPSDMYISVDRE